MTKIALISDTHSFLDDKLWKYFDTVDEIWHAGDIGSIDVLDKLKTYKKTRAVYGNIDDALIRSEVNIDNYFEIESKRVLITHIAGRPYKYSNTLVPKLLSFKPDILVCGHSHNLLVQYDKKFNLLWLNPGACGYKGFHKVKTLLRFCVDGKTVKDMEVIELGQRV